MNISSSLRLAVIALIPALLITATKAQQSTVRVKVKADLNAPPDRELGLAKTVYGDAGSFIALKTLGGKTVLGGLPEAEIGWQLQVVASDKMNLVKHDHPKVVWGIGPLAFETIETFGKQFRMLLSKPDPEHGSLMLIEQVLSPRSLTGRAAAKVADIPYDLFGKTPDYFKPGVTVGFTTTLAENGQHMLIGLTPASTTRSAGSPIVGVMVDAKMQPTWARSLATEPGNVRTDVVNTLVDGNGAAWYLVRNVSNAAPKVKEELGYSYCLYRLDSAGQQAFPLALGKKDFVQEAQVAFLPDGRVTCAGIYSNNEANRDESIGIFQMTLDQASGKWPMATRTPFNLRTVKKVERLQANMHMERVWAKSDGGLFVVAHRSGMETHTVSDLSGKKVEKTEWVNGNFHVMALDASGSATWYTEVPREMSFTNDGPGKAFSIAQGNVLFLFFNDDAGNIDLRKKKLPIEPVDKPKDALMLEFKDDGGYKERTVLAEGGKQGFFDADAIWPMGNGLFGLEGAPDFRKDRTFTVLIEMGDGNSR